MAKQFDTVDVFPDSDPVSQIQFLRTFKEEQSWRARVYSPDPSDTRDTPNGSLDLVRDRLQHELKDRDYVIGQTTHYDDNHNAYFEVTHIGSGNRLLRHYVRRGWCADLRIRFRT